MPKNKGKGGKNRRRGKNENEETKRQLEFKEPGQEYSQVVRMLGNGRCECYCFDGVTRLGHIRGKMRKKVWVSAGDIVLVGLREYQDDKAPEQRLTAATSTCNRRFTHRWTSSTSTTLTKRVT